MLTLQKRRDASSSIKTPNDSNSNPMYGHGSLYDACEILPLNPTSMNVLYLKIDAVSFNHFKRYFPRTFAYLQGLNDNVIFENFMIVGENSKPNMFPLLSGVIPASLPEFQIDDEDKHFNGDYKHFPLIWKDFEKLDNFITMYNEDNQIIGRICLLMLKCELKMKSKFFSLV